MLFFFIEKGLIDFERMFDWNYRISDICIWERNIEFEFRYNYKLLK